MEKQPPPRKRRCTMEEERKREEEHAPTIVVDANAQKKTIGETKDDATTSSSSSQSTSGDEKEECRGVKFDSAVTTIPLPMTKEQNEAYNNARIHRYDSPEAFIKYKCHIVRKNRTREKVYEKTNVDVIERAMALWNIQEGRCAFTGYSLMWKKEERNCEFIPAIVKRNPVMEWCPENVVIVCSKAAGFVYNFGIDQGFNVAEQIMEFVEFKQRNHKNTTYTKQAAHWEDECARQEKRDAWSCLSEKDKTFLRSHFANKRSGFHGNKDRRTCDEENSFVFHCIKLYETQKGRCAVSGFPLSVRYTSIDRIEGGKNKHVEGNVLITRGDINSARAHLSIDTFYEMLSDAIRWKNSQKK
jgi:hypothetical protein